MDWGADRPVLLRLYRSLVRSKLDYGCVVYSSARESYLRKLLPIHNQGLRICLGAFRTSPMHSLYVEANEPPLHIRWKKLSLQFALKLRSYRDNPTFETAFNHKFGDIYMRKPSAIPPFAIRVREALSQVCSNPDFVAQFTFPLRPPWKLDEPVVDLSLRKFLKNSTNELVFRASFNELRHKYHQYQAIYTDGSKATNRVAAAAYGRDASLQARLPDDASIFTAELQALKMAFDLIETSNGHQFIVFTDSLSSLLALKGHELKHPSVTALREAYSNLVQLQKSVVLAWVPSHVGIQGNEKVDALAKEALQMDVTNLYLPHTDYRPNINGFVKSKWQELWDSFPENKLYRVKPTVGTWGHTAPSKRRDDLVLSRARIGHTYLTHAYLLHGDERPYCIPCDCAVTVGHILIDCHEYSHIRQKYYAVPDLKTLFERTDPSLVLGFLKESKLYRNF